MHHGNSGGLLPLNQVLQVFQVYIVAPVLTVPNIGDPISIHHLCRHGAKASVTDSNGFVIRRENIVNHALHGPSARGMDGIDLAGRAEDRLQQVQGLPQNIGKCLYPVVVAGTDRRQCNPIGNVHRPRGKELIRAV